MTIQTVITSAGVVLGAGDFQRTDRNITWGIKCLELSGTQVVGIYLKADDGTWVQNFVIEDGFDMTEQEFPTVMEWFIKRFLVRLNAWLRSMFPVIAPPPVPGGTRFEQADSLIFGSLVVNEIDGTLVASSRT